MIFGYNFFIQGRSWRFKGRRWRCSSYLCFFL